MPPRVRFLKSGRSVAIRPQIPKCASHQTPLCLRLLQKRSITANEKPLPEAQESQGPNQDQLPHVSEEAAIQGKITGEGGPDIEQGTPVQEVSQYWTIEP